MEGLERRRGDVSKRLLIRNSAGSSGPTDLDVHHARSDVTGGQVLNIKQVHVALRKGRRGGRRAEFGGWWRGLTFGRLCGLAGKWCRRMVSLGGVSAGAIGWLVGVCMRMCAGGMMGGPDSMWWDARGGWSGRSQGAR